MSLKMLSNRLALLQRRLWYSRGKVFPAKLAKKIAQLQGGSVSGSHPVIDKLCAVAGASVIAAMDRAETPAAGLLRVPHRNVCSQRDRYSIPLHIVLEGCVNLRFDCLYHRSARRYIKLSK
jgi:hypothetical protein